MKVLLVSKFLHHVGGVETYLLWLSRALHDDGHEVGVVGMAPPVGEDTMAFPDLPLWTTATRTFRAGERGRTRSAVASVWSPQAGRVMARAVEEFRPDVVHFHGTCFQLTPSVVSAVARRRVATLVTAHEYKLMCANQLLFDERAGQCCTDCVGVPATTKVLAPVRRRCLKGSLPVSLLGAVEGRVADSAWRTADPLVLAPSAFMRSRLLEDGWPAARVRQLDLPWGTASQLAPDLLGTPGRRDSVTFLGRLAPVKGADVLLRAWRGIADHHPEVRLRVVGDGEDRPRLEDIVTRENIPRVDFLGRLSAPEVGVELGRSLVSAHPAQWHENSPYAVRESLMAGVPAVVSELGGMSELVGAASGRVVAHGDEGAWADALGAELTVPRACSAPLRAEVSRRAVSHEDHLCRLVDAYRTCASEAFAR